MADISWLTLGLRLLLQVAYGYSDQRDARWLPWWRRYAPSLFIALGTIAVLAGSKPMQDVAFWCWWVAFLANWWTARKNKRDKRDLRQVEAQAELTATQERAFRRECAEVTSG